MPEMLVPFWLIQIVGAFAILSYMVAEGVRTTTDELLLLLRRPGLLARSILVVLILVPLCAVLLANWLDIPRPLKLAVVLMAISPAPPMGLKRAKSMGTETGYAVSLQVTMCLLAIVSVPATLALLSAIFPTGGYIPPAQVARTVLMTQILPLGVGMTIRRLAPQVAERLFRVLVTLPGYLMLALMAAILIDVGPGLLQFRIGWTGVGVVILVTAFALAAGYWLGGPVLAVVSAARYPGLALMIAIRNFPNQRVALMVVAYTIISALTILVIHRFVISPRTRSSASGLTS
jgi:bile acid:Na+ symporter, BASS family